MKKTTKCIAIFLAIVILCSSLCGCASLDSLKENQAFLTDETSTQSITMSNGDVYLKLDSELEDSVYYSDFEFTSINLTASDVPVLLSEYYGSYLLLDDSKNFLYGDIYKDPEKIISSNKTVDEEGASQNPEDDFEFAIYCKEELYDRITKEYAEGIEYVNCGYKYYTTNLNNYEREEFLYMLTEDEKKVIEKIVKEVEPEHDVTTSYEESLICSLYDFSEDNLFCKASYEIYKTEDNEYYLARWYSDFPDEMDEYYDRFKVPEKYNKDFENITRHAHNDYNVFYD